MFMKCHKIRIPSSHELAVGSSVLYCRLWEDSQKKFNILNSACPAIYLNIDCFCAACLLSCIYHSSGKIALWEVWIWQPHTLSPQKDEDCKWKWSDVRENCKESSDGCHSCVWGLTLSDSDRSWVPCLHLLLSVLFTFPLFHMHLSPLQGPSLASCIKEVPCVLEWLRLVTVGTGPSYSICSRLSVLLLRPDFKASQFCCIFITRSISYSHLARLCWW